MPRIRLPSPFTVGLAAGIPSATEGILGVMDIAERRAGRLGRQALESRKMGILERAAAEEEKRREAWAQIPGLLEGLAESQALSQAGPRIPGVPAPAAGPLEALATVQPGQVPGVSFERVPEVPTEADLARQQARIRATAFRAGPEAVRTVQELQAEERRRQDKEKAPGFFDKGLKLLKAGNREAGLLTYQHGLMLAGIGTPLSTKEFADLWDQSPEAQRTEIDALIPELESLTKGKWNATVAGQLLLKSLTLRTPAGRHFAQQVGPALVQEIIRQARDASILDTFNALGTKAAARRVGPSATPGVAPLSVDESLADEYESLPNAATLLPVEKLPKSVQNILEARKQAAITGAKEKEKRAAVPPEERDLERRFKEAQIGAQQALTEFRKPGAKPQTLQDVTLAISRLRELDKAYFDSPPEDLKPEEITQRRQAIRALIDELLTQVKEIQSKTRPGVGKEAIKPPVALKAARDALTNALYPGRLWTQLTPEEKEAVAARMSGAP